MDTRIDVQPNGLLYYALPDKDKPTYRVLLSENPQPIDSWVLDALRENVLEVLNRPGDIYTKALVPHGQIEKGYGGFYPLPLIFATRQEREASAESYGKRPPSEAWVARKRNIILHLLGLGQLTSLDRSDPDYQAARRDAAVRHLALHGRAVLHPDVVQTLPANGRYYEPTEPSLPEVATLGYVRTQPNASEEWRRL